MSPRFLLDEHLRGELWEALAGRGAGLDVVRVGDPPDLPLRSTDPDILIWAESEGRILVSRDHATMTAYFADHLAAGRHSPGVFLIRPRSRLADVVATLVLVAEDSDADDWRDRVHYV